MEHEKWLGVCCEPNSIFVVCNQFPVWINLMRYSREAPLIETELDYRYAIQ
jgi:hypothetical protein